MRPHGKRPQHRKGHVVRAGHRDGRHPARFARGAAVRHPMLQFWIDQSYWFITGLGVSHGCSAEQENPVQARYASFAQCPEKAPAGCRIDHGRSAPASPHQPEWLLSWAQGRSDQERRISCWFALRRDQSRTVRRCFSIHVIPVVMPSHE